MDYKIEEAPQQFRSEQTPLGLGFGDGSFTALLELPPPQAMELLVKEDFPAPPPIFPSDIALVDRASKFSLFASANNNFSGNSDVSDKEINGGGNVDDSSAADDSMRVDVVKQELEDSDSNQSLKASKRKEREKKVKESSKKNKKVAANETSDEGGEKLPYVHVRARRGQATDSHSLAERARREKINARMKLLQELVPGCNKISGTAMVLDEIINHVQALQRQVEFLSMRLATVNPRVDFNIEALFTADCGYTTDNSYQGMFTPPVWPERQFNVSTEQQQLQYQHQWNFEGLHQPSWGSIKEDTSNFFTPETTSLLSYDSPSNSAATPHSIQTKNGALKAFGTS